MQVIRAFIERVRAWRVASHIDAASATRFGAEHDQQVRIDPDLDHRFATVFSLGLWGDDETRSGPGSRLGNPMAQDAIHALNHVIEAFDIRSLADIPCGDFNWFSHFIQRHPYLDYKGFDIVDQLIAQNRKNNPAFDFARFDIVSDVPEAFDLVFTKELFIHLRDSDIFKAVENMKASGSRYLLASNSFGVTNVDLLNDELGYARPVDLCSAPFDFPPPLWQSNFHALWRMCDLPESSERSD